MLERGRQAGGDRGHWGEAGMLRTGESPARVRAQTVSLDELKVSAREALMDRTSFESQKGQKGRIKGLVSNRKRHSSPS